MKHAYLIIAHHEFEILKTLLCMLDDVRNDIYLHIDKKVKSVEREEFQVSKAQLFFIENRIDTRWGDLSQVKVEYLLFETAHENGPYDYYHLLSGVDLPIKSQDYIYDFFEKYNGYEFVGFVETPKDVEGLEWLVNYYHLFTRLYKTPHRKLRKLTTTIRRHFLKIQTSLNYRRFQDIEFKRGANWVSITDELLLILLDKKKFVLKRFKFVPTADELFVQSILWNSERKNKIFMINGERKGGLREIDWLRGEPYVWRYEDLHYLQNSNNLFARKFSSSDMTIVNTIREMFS